MRLRYKLDFEYDRIMSLYVSDELTANEQHWSDGSIWPSVSDTVMNY